MVPYWISLGLALAFLRIARYRGFEKSNTFAICTCEKAGYGYYRWGVVSSALVFILLTGFRYGIGQDFFYTYVPYFARVYYGYGPQDMELGFYLLNAVVAWFTDDPTPVFLICSVIFFSFTYASILRESSNPIFSVFLLFGMSFLFIFMNAMRQMTAVSILLFSLRFIESKRPISFLLCVIVASLFHSSSVLFAIAYVFPLLNIGWISCACAVVLTFVFRNQFADLVNLVISKTQYAGYIGSVFDNGETGFVIIAMNVVVLMFCAIVPRLNHLGYSGRYRMLLWCQLICTLISILSGLIPLSQRLRWVFALPSIILLPLALDSIRDEKMRAVVGASISALYIVYISITIGLWNGNGVLPYQTVLFGGF